MLTRTFGRSHRKRPGLIRLVLVVLLLALSPQRSLGQSAEAASKSTYQAAHRPRVALVLGGGGARGAAHIGVLRIFEQEHIPIDYIVGNSIGSIIGGLYCAGVSLDKTEDLLRNKVISEVYVPKFIWARVLFIPVRPIFYVFRSMPSAGLASQNKIYKFLSKQIPPGKRTIETLSPRFEAVAIDLNEGKVHSFRSGNLARAMVASSALPGLFRPVEIDSHLYMDGGIGANVPTDTAEKIDADVVIAVVVDQQVSEAPTKSFRSYRTLASRLINLALKSMDERLRHNADIVIAPTLNDSSIFDDSEETITRAIRAGEDAARRALPSIRVKVKQSSKDFGARSIEEG